jgi:adenylate cyclase
MTAERYQFGDLLIDVQRQLVHRDGTEIPLPPLSYELLLALLRAHPRMVSVDELLTSVWAPVIVNPETVGQRIKLLRSALGDDPGNARYIGGVRGRGYRLVAAVTPLPGPEPAAVADSPMSPAQRIAPPSEPAARPARGQRFRQTLVTATIVVLAGTSALLMWRPWSTKALVQPAVPPLAGLAPAGPPPERSIAILPFLDLTNDQDRRYFADGTTEEVTSMLSQLPDLRVSARTSAYYFKDRPTPVRDIGKALGVAYVLEGSVRASHDMLRVTVQLIRTDTGYHVWSADYNRKADDVFKIQDDIAQEVATKLKTLVVRPTMLSDSMSTNLDARKLYLQSIVALGRNTREGLHQGIDDLQKAIRVDPKFAKAWALLANAYLATIIFDDASPAKERPLALDAAQHALAIDPTLADGHMALAQWLASGWNVSAALAEIHQVVEAEPNNWLALQLAASLEGMAGEFEKALALQHEVISLDPINDSAYVNLGATLWFAGQDRDAIRAFQVAIALNPKAQFTNYPMALAQLTSGNPKAALESIEHGNDHEETELLRPLMLEALGQKAAAAQGQAVAEQKYGSTAGTDLALYYGYRGDADQTLYWLGKGLERGDPGMPTIAVNPIFKRFRADPRFQAMLHRFNLPG